MLPPDELRRPVRRFTDAEEQEAVRLCRLGWALDDIAEVLDRNRTSVRHALKRHGMRTIARQPRQVFRATGRPPRNRGTQAPKPLPAAARSTYPVNFAGHARWLRW